MKNSRIVLYIIGIIFAGMILWAVAFRLAGYVIAGSVIAGLIWVAIATWNKGKKKRQWNKGHCKPCETPWRVDDDFDNTKYDSSTFSCGCGKHSFKH